MMSPVEEQTDGVIPSARLDKISAMVSVNGGLPELDQRMTELIKKQGMNPAVASLKTHGMITPPESPLKTFDFALNAPQIITQEDQPVIAVLGVGYVGEHLVKSFSSHFPVIGFDVLEERIETLNRTRLQDRPVLFTCNADDLRPATHFLIAVPTLLKPDSSVDTSYLVAALETVVKMARKGATVVIESSAAVGMTEELLGPLAKEHGFYAGMSPEVGLDASPKVRFLQVADQVFQRVDPGRTEPPVHLIPKLISGLDDVVPGSLQAVRRVYQRVFNRVIPMTTTKAAEMTKLYENCQRMINIAFCNEMADACAYHSLNPFEITGAAGTKPFGYSSYSPSLGVGGHCIPVNPHYLFTNNMFPLLQMATQRMKNRPIEIGDRIAASLALRRPKGAKHRVLVVGMAFKAGQSHLANSPGLDLAKHLMTKDTLEVLWADALVTQKAIEKPARLADEDWRVEVLNTFDFIVVAFAQHHMDMSLLDQLDGVEVEKWYQDNPRYSFAS